MQSVWQGKSNRLWNSASSVSCMFPFLQDTNHPNPLYRFKKPQAKLEKIWWMQTHAVFLQIATNWEFKSCLISLTHSSPMNAAGARWGGRMDAFSAMARHCWRSSAARSVWAVGWFVQSLMLSDQDFQALYITFKQALAELWYLPMNLEPWIGWQRLSCACRSI